MKTKVNLYNLLWELKHLPSTIFRWLKNLVKFVRFVMLIFIVFGYYLLHPHSAAGLMKKNQRKGFFLTALLARPYAKLYHLALRVLDTSKAQEMKSSDMILLAIKNLTTKKARSYVTVGGMAIGFGAVILLLSAGYGFERLVVSEIANLSEMKQVDVTISSGSPLVFNSEAMEAIKNIEHVKSVIPIVTSVSKITYNDAVSDVIVYAVPTEYFDEVSMRPLEGVLFSDNTKTLKSEVVLPEDGKGEVAGASTVLISSQASGSEVYHVRYSIDPLVWVPVYETPDYQSRIIGYTKREPGPQEAVEVWGSVYPDGAVSARDIDGISYNTWISDEYALWNNEPCLVKDPACVDSAYVVQRDAVSQMVRPGFITERSVSVDRYALATDSAYEVFSGKLIAEISFSVQPEATVTGYFDSDVSSTSTEIQFSDQVGEYPAQLVYGVCDESARSTCVTSSAGEMYGYWVRAELRVWGDPLCSDVCDRYTLNPHENNTESIAVQVYFRAADVVLSDTLQQQLVGERSVLGAESSAPNEDNGNFIDIESLIGSDDTIDWATVASELGTSSEVEKDVKQFPKNAQGQALVNTAMLNLLGISVSEALDEKFEATLIFDSKLFDKSNYTVETEQAEFTISGIVSDSATPTFYIPFSDVLVDGLNNASTLKIVSTRTSDVAEIRKAIEGLGFQTSSVVDTVASVSSFFDNLRIALLVLGLIALGVASLGMFNTLTVSLLEKTQEVGLLKTMGLKSDEVSTLFLAESMIMSVLGGVVGLFLGFAVGKLMSLLISLMSFSQGSGFMDVTYIPLSLGLSIVALSAVVGILTGWYPANRAKKISALNALRYE